VLAPNKQLGTDSVDKKKRIQEHGIQSKVESKIMEIPQLSCLKK